MLTTLILKCVLLAKTEILILESPVNEYGMATLTREFNGAHFEATVVEERMNSVSIAFLELGTQTMSYSIKDLAMKSLSTRLDVKNEHASMDCELN